MRKELVVSKAWKKDWSFLTDKYKEVTCIPAVYKYRAPIGDEYDITMEKTTLQGVNDL